MAAGAEAATVATAVATLSAATSLSPGPLLQLMPTSYANTSTVISRTVRNSAAQPGHTGGTAEPLKQSTPGILDRPDVTLDAGVDKQRGGGVAGPASRFARGRLRTAGGGEECVAVKLVWRRGATAGGEAGGPVASLTARRIRLKKMLRLGKDRRSNAHQQGYLPRRERQARRHRGGNDSSSTPGRDAASAAGPSRSAVSLLRPMHSASTASTTASFIGLAAQPGRVAAVSEPPTPPTALVVLDLTDVTFDAGVDTQRSGAANVAGPSDGVRFPPWIPPDRRSKPAPVPIRPGPAVRLSGPAPVRGNDVTQPVPPTVSPTVVESYSGSYDSLFGLPTSHEAGGILDSSGRLSGATAVLAKKAELGDAAAQCAFGALHEDGRKAGLQRSDLVEAARWYRAAGDKSSEAQRRLAQMYLDGRGMAPDDDQAATHFRRAAEMGDAIAQLRIGMMLELGRGVPKDGWEAVKWYRPSADQGIADAQYAMGLVYLQGHRRNAGQRRDSSGSRASMDRELVREAVQGGDNGDDGDDNTEQPFVGAQSRASEPYTREDAAAVDIREALKYLKKAARQDHCLALLELGRVHEVGLAAIGMPVDDARAAWYYQHAAELGHPIALRILGLMYEKGRGVARDPRKAEELLARAADLGDVTASGLLDVLRGQGVGTVSSSSSTTVPLPSSSAKPSAPLKKPIPPQTLNAASSLSPLPTNQPPESDEFLFWRPRPLRDRSEMLSQGTLSAETIPLFADSTKDFVTPVESMQEIINSLREKLQPIEVDRCIKNLCDKATEKRESALDEIRSWFSTDSTDRNILLFHGDAWSGKSVFFACTIDDLKRDHTAIVFVCDYNNLDRSNARRAIATLAIQIAEFVSDQARLSLDTISKQEVQSLPLSNLFHRLIAQPLMTLNSARIIIAIDALDELRADVDELRADVDELCLAEFLAVDSFGPGLLVRGVRDDDEGVIRLAFRCSHEPHSGHSESEKEKNRQLAAESAKLLSSPLLHDAAKRNRAGICRLLLDCGGVDVNAIGPPPTLGTALHAAAQARADDVFGLLLDEGVDPLARNADGKTAPDLYPDYFEMLERKAKRKTVLQVSFIMAESNDALSSAVDALAATLLAAGGAGDRDPVDAAAVRARTADAAAIARLIDHTLLAPAATINDVRSVCADAVRLGAATVCVNSSMVPVAARALRDAQPAAPAPQPHIVRAIAVVGFPFGAACTEAKAREAEAAVAAGAAEIDMVLHLGLLKSGDLAAALADVRAVVRAAAPAPVKVIIESALLDPREIVAASYLACLAGAAFVKTSTGYAPGGGGATVQAVRIMYAVANSKGLGWDAPPLIKASGGIRSLATVRSMLAAGASRIGASGTQAIVDELLREQGALPQVSSSASTSTGGY
ncbi:hypothetical protein HK405_006703 [Cladochytrium tenue]|nr:hypothetical protein HK405_006703 [Cladochytrium tenue]